MNRKQHRIANLFVGVLIVLFLHNSAWAQLKEIIEWGRGSAGETSVLKTIAHFKIAGPVAETPIEIPSLFGDAAPVSLKSLLERFKEARHDDSVVAVVLDVQNAQLGFAQLQELHQEMRKFQAVDKEVYVHADMLSTGTYALATGASHLSVVPSGDLWIMGLFSESPYLRGTLDKLGIVPDIERSGDYKSAGETFMRSGPSEEAQEMNDWLLDSLYESLIGIIAEGRDMTTARVRDLINQGPYSAEDAKAVGLIDSVKHRQDFISDLRTRYGDTVRIVANYGEGIGREMPDPDDFFGMISFIMEMLNPGPKVYKEPTVAIVYVEGVIQIGSAEISPFGQPSGAYSTTIRKALDRAAEDPSVKAVVLRVDSPGGSALASEIIWDATQRVADNKPLIVSMGNVAGSGGYYVSCGANAIFADPTTITASIGVLGGKLVTTDAWKKIGVNWHANQRGEMAGILSSSSRFSDAERAKIRQYMDRVYGIFKQRVVDGRGEQLAKPIDEMAGGRVFTGEQALKLGLVDKMGGLEDAIKYAAQKAGVGDFEIRVIPDPPTLFDLFQHRQGDDEYAGVLIPQRKAQASSPLLDVVFPIVEGLDPVRTQAVLKMIQRMDVLNRENVLMAMPAEWVIR